MSRHASRRGGPEAPWLGVITCDRLKCPTAVEFPLTNQPPERPLWNGSDYTERKATYDVALAAHVNELLSFPQPAWLTVTWATERPRSFCSPRCARLWIQEQERAGGPQ